MRSPAANAADVADVAFNAARTIDVCSSCWQTARTSSQFAKATPKVIRHDDEWSFLSSVSNFELELLQIEELTGNKVRYSYLHA